MPSEKYSWSLSGLMSAKAMTAIDGSSLTAGTVSAVPVGEPRSPRPRKNANPAASRATAAKPTQSLVPELLVLEGAPDTGPVAWLTPVSTSLRSPRSSLRMSMAEW